MRRQHQPKHHREPQAVRQRYGIHPWGQRALMARRLVEAGVSFVTMVMENCIPPGQPMPGNARALDLRRF